MKTLTLSLALGFVLLTVSTASAAVAVRVGPLRIAAGHPVARHAYVHPRPLVYHTPQVVTPAPVYRYPSNFWTVRQERIDTVEDVRQERLDTFEAIRNERRAAFWNAVNAQQQ